MISRFFSFNKTKLKKSHFVQMKTQINYFEKVLNPVLLFYMLHVVF
jgi:hypothetical protein